VIDSGIVGEGMKIWRKRIKTYKEQNKVTRSE
jgi:hypothetical protein